MLNDGTAIGDGLSSAINRLCFRQCEVKENIILLTDGTNNAGDVVSGHRGENCRAEGNQNLHYRRGYLAKILAPSQSPIRTLFFLHASERWNETDNRIDEQAAAQKYSVHYHTLENITS